MSKQCRYQSLILFITETNSILTTLLNLGNVQYLLDHVIMIFKLLMTLISVIMMIVNSINTGTMVCTIYIQFIPYFLQYSKTDFRY